MVPAKLLRPHPLAGADRGAVLQGADPGLSDDERGCAGRPPVQPRRGADPARLLGGRPGRSRDHRRGRGPQAHAPRAGAGQRTALALQRDLPTADAGRARSRHRGAGAREKPAGAVGACPDAGRGLAAGAAVPASVARPADLERARLVPRHWRALHRGGLDLRAPAQCALEAPGVRRPSGWPGAQRAPAGERYAERDDRGLSRLQSDGRRRRAGRPRA
ncbi:hypothetical protein D3C85_1050470 [compost metagenome]